MLGSDHNQTIMLDSEHKKIFILGITKPIHLIVGITKPLFLKVGITKACLWLVWSDGHSSSANITGVGHVGNGGHFAIQTIDCTGTMTLFTLFSL